MRLIDNNRIVGEQGRVTLGFRQQNAIGHELDISPRAYLVGKTHLVTHRVAQWTIEFGSNARRHRARRDAPRLRMPDHPRHSAPEFKANFW